MGDFWTRHNLDNGKPMNPRQIQRVDQLEAEIAYHEHEIDECSEAIARIKRGSKHFVKELEEISF